MCCSCCCTLFAFQIAFFIVNFSEIDDFFRIFFKQFFVRRAKSLKYPSVVKLHEKVIQLGSATLTRRSIIIKASEHTFLMSAYRLCVYFMYTIASLAWEKRCSIFCSTPGGHYVMSHATLEIIAL